MTGNSKQIKQLKHQQAEKKHRIKRCKKRMKRNIFLFCLGMTLLAYVCLDHAYQSFGSVKNFLLATAGISIVLIMLYYFYNVSLTKGLEKDIKAINAKLYRLMKLEE